MSDFFSRRAWFHHVGGPRRPNNIVRAALFLIQPPQTTALPPGGSIEENTVNAITFKRILPWNHTEMSSYTHLSYQFITQAILQ